MSAVEFSNAWVLNLSDVRIDTYDGGDKTVRVTHIPSGLVTTLAGNRSWSLDKLKKIALSELGQRVAKQAEDKANG